MRLIQQAQRLLAQATPRISSPAIGCTHATDDGLTEQPSWAGARPIAQRPRVQCSTIWEHRKHLRALPHRNQLAHAPRQ